MEPNESGTGNQDLFDNIEPRLVQASHGKRFVNYLVDVLAFNILLFIILVISTNLYPPLLSWIEKKVNTEFTFVEQMLIIVSYGTFMFVVEATSKGKSIGKLITGTRAVRQDGTTITVRDAQIRGLCRMIPFHPLSAIGIPCYPWHDRWSKTFVIDEKASGYRLPS